MRVNNSHGMTAAVEAGLGVGILPCWMGDSSPTLERVLPGEVFPEELWLVVHRDLRQVARIRAVAEFFVRELGKESARLMGKASKKS